MISLEYMQELSLKAFDAISGSSASADRYFRIALVVLLQGIAERLDAIEKDGGSKGAEK